MNREELIAAIKFLYVMTAYKALWLDEKELEKQLWDRRN